MVATSQSPTEFLDFVFMQPFKITTNWNLFKAMTDEPIHMCESIQMGWTQ